METPEMGRRGGGGGGGVRVCLRICVVIVGNLLLFCFSWSLWDFVQLDKKYGPVLVVLAVVVVVVNDRPREEFLFLQTFSI